MTMKRVGHSASFDDDPACVLFMYEVIKIPVLLICYKEALS